MRKRDVVVVGAGISGLAFAFRAARAGRSVLVLERGEAPGGCLATRRTASGYWFELGAHTCYNSYVGLVELVEACGLGGEVVRRVPTKLRFLDGDRLVPGANLAVLLRLFSWPELAVSFPRVLFARKDGKTVREFYASIVGRRNYEKVLGPMLSAVPSQSADGFPAGMLFKSRATRREDFPRSFTLRGGLQSVTDALARQAGVEVATGRPASGLSEGGAGWIVECDGGEAVEATAVAVATPPSAAASLLAGAAPGLAAQAARVKETTVDTLSFAVEASKVSLPVSMFLIPRDDVFFSVVTRDSVPDPRRRAFSFHFRPGLTPEKRLERATRLLGLDGSDVEEVTERRAVLPSPGLGHEEVVREVDRLSAGLRLAVLGNWFSGLSIEDCVDRARREWARLEAAG
ncbi:MAG: FAD-dependent oxidoreductase [Acidobacteria bacterium]|nr:MAG: FAD-dependent oxidoreductase [Acidobacteriota bacterium]